MTEFYNDLNNARAGELLVKRVLENLTNDYDFTHLLDWKTYGHKGDILARNIRSGETYYIEVKTDSRIAETNNVLCETQKYFYASGYKPGSMSYDYQFYCVLSVEARKLYIIDFSILKKLHRGGKFITIYHDEDITYGYLLNIDTIKQNGGLLFELSY